VSFEVVWEPAAVDLCSRFLSDDAEGLRALSTPWTHLPTNLDQPKHFLSEHRGSTACASAAIASCTRSMTSPRWSRSGTSVGALDCAVDGRSERPHSGTSVRSQLPRPTAEYARGVEFSRELRAGVLSGDITVTFRLWRSPKVKVGGRYRVDLGQIEVDCIEVVPFAEIDESDLSRSGETDRESLRRRAAHAGPIQGDTLL